MKLKFLTLTLLAAALMPTVWGGTLGKVIAIGGQASDLALDEPRGVLYVADLTGNRVDVLSLSDNQVHRQINVPAQPSSLSLSPDGKYLLIAHYGNFKDTAGVNGLTLIDLTTNGRQTFNLANPPLGVSFGIDGRALVVTSTEFDIFEPKSGVLQTIQTIDGFKAVQIPVPPGNFPPSISAASVAASGDGRYVIGLTDTFEFLYDVLNRGVQVIYYTSVPLQGPRVVSFNQDGTTYTSGWLVNSTAPGPIRQFLFTYRLNEFRDPSGILTIGSSVIDSKRNLVYWQQCPQSQKGPNNTCLAPPMLTVGDLDNLNIRQQFKLSENLAGKSVLTADSNTMYAISASGITVIPVGSLGSVPQVSANAEDLQFRGNYCTRQIASQTLQINDPSGGQSDYSITSDTPGVNVTPAFGVTPARVTVAVDANQFQNQKGTVVATLTINSGRATNVIKKVRVLVNLRDPDQRGSVLNIPGKLVDILADPARNRIYVLRQDNNSVYVYDATNYTQITTLRTSNTPTQLAMTYDGRYLMIGSDDSQYIPVYDLDTLAASDAIIMPGGHYPRSIGVSASDILVATRVAGPIHVIDRVDFYSRTAAQLPTLGVFTNDIDINTTLIGTPNGSSILAVSKNGVVRIYSNGTWSTRQDFTALAGTYAASDSGLFVVGNNLLNASAVPVGTFETASGTPTGFAFSGTGAFRTTSATVGQPGTIQKVDLATGTTFAASRVSESPVLGDSLTVFTRDLAMVNNTLVNLTVSGITVLPFNYDISVAPPRINSIVNAADSSAKIAPGGLISIYGSQLSPITQASSSVPLPTAIGDSCLTINGLPVPVLFVSPSQINAQLPIQATGNVTLVLKTPGGTSDNFILNVSPTAPSIFTTSVGTFTGVATMVRASNNEIVTPSNPIHRGDTIVIYLTGLGATIPAVPDGQPAPSDVLARTIITPTVTIGGVNAIVDFSGLTPGYAGLDQLNIEIPKNAPEGLSIPLVITSGGSSVTINVRVVN